MRDQFAMKFSISILNAETHVHFEMTIKEHIHVVFSLLNKIDLVKFG